MLKEDSEVFDRIAELYLNLYLQNHIAMSPAPLEREQLIAEALDFAILYLNKRRSKLR